MLQTIGCFCEGRWLCRTNAECPRGGPDGALWREDFAGFLEALRSGELYVNVHTAANPGGEIRSQIDAAP
jgi:hypothetical protein